MNSETGYATSRLDQAVRDNTTTEAMAQRINAMDLDLTGALDRLVNVANRLFGQGPENNSKSPSVEPVSSGTLGGVNDSLNRLERTVAAAHGIVSRFGDL